MQHFGTILLNPTAINIELAKFHPPSLYLSSRFCHRKLEGLWLWEQSKNDFCKHCYVNLYASCPRSGSQKSGFQFFTPELKNVSLHQHVWDLGVRLLQKPPGVAEPVPGGYQASIDLSLTLPNYLATNYLS